MEGGDEVTGDFPKHLAHSLVVSGGDDHEVEGGENEDELSASSPSLDAGVFF